MSLPIPAEDPSRPSDVVDRPVLRISGPGQIVQLVPYILGFHPDDSLVLIALRGRRILASVRNDLEAPIEMVAPWCVAVARAGADRVVGVLYSDDVTGQPLPRVDYVDELSELFRTRELDVLDLLAVSGGRWWSYHCRNDACCPHEGMPIDPAGPIAASAVTEGLVALPNREELRRELAIDLLAVNLVEAQLHELDQSEPFDPQTFDGPERRAADWTAVRRFVKRARKQSTVSPEQAAPVLLALTDKHVRDAVMGYLVTPPDPMVRDAWRRLTTMAPPDLRAAPALLYAMWCYADGAGARANMGIDTALEANPTYTMAHLLLELQASGLNPYEVIHDMAKEAAKGGRRIQRRRPPSPSSDRDRGASGLAG